jgi:hypothetical protein
MWHRSGDDYVAWVASLKIVGVEDDNDVDRILGSKPRTGEVD